MISVLDYGSISIASYPIRTWSIWNSSTAAHNSFTIFIRSGIVDAIHLIREIWNILQLLVWGSWNQSDCL